MQTIIASNIKNNFVITATVNSDVDVRTFATSTVARFTVAIRRNEVYNNQSHVSQAIQPVEIWRKNEEAEALKKITKGMHLYLSGFFKPEEWDDAQGNHRNRMILVATKAGEILEENAPEQNEFCVSGFIANEARINEFATSCVARFPIAIAQSQTVGNETKRTSAFCNVEMWRKVAQRWSLEGLSKGRRISIEGSFKPETWTDNNGHLQSRVVLLATRIYEVVAEQAPVAVADPEPQVAAVADSANILENSFGVEEPQPKPKRKYTRRSKKEVAA